MLQLGGPIYVSSDNEFNIYSNLGILLTAISCTGIMINARENMNKEFVNIILKTLENHTNINKTEIKKIIVAEWNTNKDFYKKITDTAKNINMEYNELLLVILSKILSIGFEIQDKYGNVKLIIDNNDLNFQQIKLKLLFDQKDDKFNNKIILVSNDKLAILSF